jgi:hypothetical protein
VEKAKEETFDLKKKKLLQTSSLSQANHTLLNASEIWIKKLLKARIEN